MYNYADVATGNVKVSLKEKLGVSILVTIAEIEKFNFLIQKAW